MSTKKNSRQSQDKNKKGRLTEKAMSFHGHAAEEMVGKLRRPRTVPDLISGRVASPVEMVRPKLTKLLLNVTVQRSLGPLQVLISPESTVNDLVAASLRQYSKEGRRPILPSPDPSNFGLHYSQFSLESLDPDEKLIELGSRNFFLCPKQTATAAGNGDDDGRVGVDYTVTTLSAPTSSTCSKEADKVTKNGVVKRVLNGPPKGLACLLKGVPCFFSPTKKAINPMVGVTSKKGELQRTCLCGFGM